MLMHLATLIGLVLQWKSLHVVAHAALMYINVNSFFLATHNYLNDLLFIALSFAEILSGLEFRV